VHGELDAGARLELPRHHRDCALYVAHGSVEIDGHTLHAGQLAVVSPGQAAVVRATQSATVMALGGEPLGTRYIDWNFVSSSKARIEQAKADWRAGRMKLPDLDHHEFISLPPEPAPPANPMS
jgi:redox-sensitive bicupin YhaK (pirin superfamily)